jgi:hypothetical protein
MHLNQFPFGQVATWLAEGSVVPFLGSGASRLGVSGLTGLPDGRGLASELVIKMGEAYPGKPTDDLPKVAQYYEQPFLDRPALYEYLHDRFYKKQISAPLARTTQLLAAMPNLNTVWFIVTTNYDVFVERAFDKAGRPLCVITQNMRDPENGAGKVNLLLPDGTRTQEDAAKFLWKDRKYPNGDKFPDGTVYLFKMHGSADREMVDSADDDMVESRDDLIITENDYVDFLVNTGGTNSPNFPPASLATAFKTKRFLFLGYSLQDWNFRAFLRLLVLRNALSGKDKLRHWAIQLGPSKLDEELWSQRNVNVYDGDLIEFCNRLEAAWASEVAQ